MDIRKEIFGKTGGKNSFIFTIANKNGIRVRITDYGATIVSIETPDKDGHPDDIVLGYDSLEQYIGDKCYFGCTVGRFANRIAEGRFTLDGAEYRLAVNNSPNHLHGGIKGFNKFVWDPEPLSNGALFSRTSHDGEEGYPGNLSCTVSFTLTDDNRLTIQYRAQTDKTTIVNLTNHSYFNLAGHKNGDIRSHEITINADNYTPTDETNIPTGDIKSVIGTPLDFRKPTPIGRNIDTAGGYDHNFVLNKKPDFSACVYEPKSGRKMLIKTTQPAIQLYTGNFLDNIGGK